MSDSAPPESSAPGGELPSEIAELAAGFIHEIKNHLGTLSLNLQLLAEDFETAQTPRERRALEREVAFLRSELARAHDAERERQAGQ